MTLRRDQFERRAKSLRTDALDALIQAGRHRPQGRDVAEAWRTNAAIALTAATALEQVAASFDTQEPYLSARLDEYAREHADEIAARKAELERRATRTRADGDD